MEIEKVYFNSMDDINLFGLLHKGTSKSKKVVLSVHGMTSNCLKMRENIFAEEYCEKGIDYFCFNNRGADIMRYYEKVIGGKLVTRIEAGTANEFFEECYYDIKGAIIMLLEKGYDEIYLQGHSYGAAKSVYTYNMLKRNGENDILSHIKSVILLSIVDIPRMCRAMLGEKYEDIIFEVKQMLKENMGEELIKREYFLHPLCARNFLFINEIGGTVDVVPFGADKPNFDALNSIECPLLMFWGREKDMIMQKPEALEKIIRTNTEKTDIEIRFVAETGHNYRHKERETACEIIKILKNR